MAQEKYKVRNRYTNEVQFTAEIECAPDALPSLKLGLAVRWGFANSKNLSAADLRGADLRAAYLSAADLRGADLRGADLRGADLRAADLSAADLRDAYLRDAYLRGADLRAADLSDADLSGADLSGADLRGAYLSDADLSGAYLSDADLSGAYLRDAYLRPIKADVWLTLTQAGAPHVVDLIDKLRAGRVNGATYGDSSECACLVGTLERHGATNMLRDANSPAERWFAPIRPGDTPDKTGEGAYRARIAIAWAEEWCARNGVTISETGAA